MSRASCSLVYIAIIEKIGQLDILKACKYSELNVRLIRCITLLKCDHHLNF